VLAIQSELIGAHALGIRNILCLRGDPPRVGDSPAARPVWEVDSVGLITIVANLNRGLDANGSPIGPSASFLIGAAVNPNAPDLDREIRLMRRKAEAGAAFFVTQPMYDVGEVERFLDRAGALPAPVLVGLLPLVSTRHADYLDNEVPGIAVPAWAKERLDRAGDAAAEAGLEMATSFLDRVRGWVSGAYVIPSFSRYDIAARLVGAARAMVG
jgi:homocysteine S-methyltransferase